ncbi:MAG: 2-oxoacid:ferredoxin oxidoreductase subunit beta [Saprospiraceae bacterium]|nr:2-oxoacid:ferredoxin oxidoreductase subunit beta [Saprospiraceae bacterium]MBK8632769.1 2-oxoacid:ferredoxin oxidoreductase subunit beta [Saprospiraceae bacterium]
MTYIKPAFRHPDLQPNAIGFHKKDYEGAISTLCAGCGHDSISSAIVQACFDLAIEPHKIAKISGIGCSSKTPTYYLGQSHGFNSVHGRMPSVATGAYLANRNLKYIGVSGDGDTASIGMGQFVHAIRRNLNVVYIVMNNGCYGLTKGQDSATADEGSISKKGQANPFEAIDLASLAMELGATFVGRSFSGDKTQLIPLIKAALSHPGFAFLDVISPCVTFNNNKGSTKSYDYTREHIEATGTMDFVPFEQEITVDYPEGSSKSIAMHDGSIIELSKLANGWDPQDRMASFMKIQEARIKGQILTGLLYIDPETKDLHQMLNTTEKSLNQLEANVLSPGLKSLVDINNEYR